MAQHNQLGKTGEERAAEYLISKIHYPRHKLAEWKNGIGYCSLSDKKLIMVEPKHEITTLRLLKKVTFRKIKNIIQATDAYIRYVRYTFSTYDRHHYLSRGK